ncbi:unnamed protein product [Amoebophrya sp. A120]|nr:unnamed protein product [Amoebophrya sp. A120]|eukprot:GSA120T00003494001.1
MTTTTSTDGYFRLTVSPTGATVAAAVSRTGGSFSVDLLRSSDLVSESSFEHPAMVTDISFVNDDTFVTTCLDGRLRLLRAAGPAKKRKIEVLAETELGQDTGIDADDRTLCYACAVYRAGDGHSSSTSSSSTGPKLANGKNSKASADTTKGLNIVLTPESVAQLRIVAACREVIEVFRVITTADGSKSSLQRIGTPIEHLHVEVINQLSFLREHILVSGGDDGLVNFTDMRVWEQAVLNPRRVSRNSSVDDVDMTTTISNPSSSAAGAAEHQGGRSTTAGEVEVDSGTLAQQDVDEGFLFTINNDENVRSFLIVEEFAVVLCASTNETVSVWSFGGKEEFGQLRRLVQFTDEIRSCEQLLSGERDGFHTLGCVLSMWFEQGKIFVLGGSCDGAMMLFHLNLTQCVPVQEIGSAHLEGEYFVPERSGQEDGATSGSDATTSDGVAVAKRLKSRLKSADEEEDVGVKENKDVVAAQRMAGDHDLAGGVSTAQKHEELVRCCAVLRAADSKSSTRELWTGDESGRLCRWFARGRKRCRATA